MVLVLAILQTHLCHVPKDEIQDILWMVAKSISPAKDPWNDSIRLQMATDVGFNHGLKVLRNGFRPLVAPSHPLSFLAF